MLLCTGFAAFTGVMAQLEIPLPLIPISGQTLAVGLSATVLGSLRGASAMIIYAGMGVAGLPVFAGGASGWEVVSGTSGGYILGFIPAAYLIGLLIERKGIQLTTAIYANLVGTALILLCGMIQLQSLLDLSWSEALKAGVIPFLPVGIIKALLAAYFGVLIQKKGRNSPLRKTA